MSTTQELTAPTSNPFMSFKLDELLSALAFETGVTIVDGEVVASQPASSATVVSEGLVRDVPEHWTIGDLAMKLITSRLGSAEVKVAVAKAAVDKAHVAEALAIAQKAAVDAAQQQADDAREASVPAVPVDAAPPSAQNTEINVDHAFHRAIETQRAADIAVDEAIAAIAAIPTPARQSYVATLAPEFAHLAGEMVEGDGRHPSKPSFSGVPADIVGFCCTSCKSYNLVRSAVKNWYAIYAGHAVGIFYGNHRAGPLTSRVSGASFKGFHTLEEATAAFANALIERKVCLIPRPVIL